MNKFESAMKCFSRAIELNEKDFKAYFYKGNCLFELKKYNEAFNLYYASLRIQPKNHLVLNAMGNSYLEIKETFFFYIHIIS